MDYKPVFEILWKLANTTMILNLTYKKTLLYAEALNYSPILESRAI